MKFGLRLMLFMESIFMLAGGLFAPIYAIYVENIGGSILDVGIASFIYFLTSGIVVYIISKWEDRYKHKEHLYIIGYFLLAWSYLGFLIIETRMQLFVLQVVQGIALAISVPVRDALYTKFLQKGKETSQWGYWEIIAHISYAVSALGGGYFAFTYGFKNLFLSMFFMIILGVGAFAFLYARNRKILNKA